MLKTALEAYAALNGGYPTGDVEAQLVEEQLITKASELHDFEPTTGVLLIQSRYCGVPGARNSE